MCLTLFFLWGWLHRNIFFNLGEMNFSVSSPRPTEKKHMFFLCVYLFFLCGLTHRKISFNLGENNFSVRVRPTEKLFLTVNTQNNWIFLSLYFCGYFSEGTPSEKYFSDGIRIFLCVFAPTEKSQIPVVKCMQFYVFIYSQMAVDQPIWLFDLQRQGRVYTLFGIIYIYW